MRAAGVTLPKDKRIAIALTYIKGIGKTSAVHILQKAHVSDDVRVKDLKQDEEDRLRMIVEKEYKTEGDLTRETLLNVKRLTEIKAYRGIRHARYLPVRGQKTKTNNRTVRGNVRKSAGSGRKPAAQKT